MEHTEIEQSRWFVDAVLPHEAGLRRWIHSRFSEIRDVDDLIQEAFSRILKAYQSGPVPNPQAFLFVVSRNLAINRLRRKNLEHPPEAESVDPHVLVDEMAGPFESAALQEEIDDLVSAFQFLPERCRQVMTLRKIYGLSQKEIAAELGISVHTVEAQVGIGLRKCRAFFHQRGYQHRFKK
jgi:RNA polymerase sigma-70 factor (ECF subfamily)